MIIIVKQIGIICKVKGILVVFWLSNLSINFKIFENTNTIFISHKYLIKTMQWFTNSMCYLNSTLNNVPINYLWILTV